MDESREEENKIEKLNTVRREQGVWMREIKNRETFEEVLRQKNGNVTSRPQEIMTNRPTDRIIDRRKLCFQKYICRKIDRMIDIYIDR